MAALNGPNFLREAYGISTTHAGRYGSYEEYLVEEALKDMNINIYGQWGDIFSASNKTKKELLNKLFREVNELSEEIEEWYNKVLTWSLGPGVFLL